MTKADELLDKYWGAGKLITKHDFIAALAEYGAAVRKRDAEICVKIGFGHLEKFGPIAISTVCNNCAAAIEREPLI